MISGKKTFLRSFSISFFTGAHSKANAIRFYYIQYIADISTVDIPEIGQLSLEQFRWINSATGQKIWGWTVPLIYVKKYKPKKKNSLKCKACYHVDVCGQRVMDDGYSYEWAHACVDARQHARVLRCFYASVCVGVNAHETHLPYSHVCSHATRSHGDNDTRRSPPCWCTRVGSRRCPCCTRLCLWGIHMQHVSDVETSERWDGGKGEKQKRTVMRCGCSGKGENEDKLNILLQGWELKPSRMIKWAIPALNALCSLLLFFYYSNSWRSIKEKLLKKAKVCIDCHGEEYLTKENKKNFLKFVSLCKSVVVLQSSTFRSQQLSYLGLLNFDYSLCLFWKYYFPCVSQCVVLRP